MKKHICKEDKTCSCSRLSLDPSDNCPIHGSGEYPKRCGTCGKFIVNLNEEEQIKKLPKWAKDKIYNLEQELEKTKRETATIPWTKEGMEWFTLFWPGENPQYRAPEKLFTCGKNGTLCVCTLGPKDYVFVGRG